jgi:hypothetical protein
MADTATLVWAAFSATLKVYVIIGAAAPRGTAGPRRTPLWAHAGVPVG